MDKIKKIERKLSREILKTKDELVKFGVDLEGFCFEFEPRYRKLLEALDNSEKIYHDLNKVGFALFLPSLTDKQKDFVVYFAVTLQECIVTTGPKGRDSKETSPYLYISIPTLSRVSEEEAYAYLLPNDLFSLEEFSISFKFYPSVKYREFII